MFFKKFDKQFCFHKIEKGLCSLAQPLFCFDSSSNLKPLFNIVAPACWQRQVAVCKWRLHATVLTATLCASNKVCDHSKSAYNKYFFLIFLNAFNSGCQLALISFSVLLALIIVISCSLPASLLKK